MKPAPVEGDGIRLRPFRDDDAAELAAGVGDPLTLRFLPSLPGPYTLADARWWITEGAPRQWAGGGAAYAIADPATDRLLGGASLSRVVVDRGQVEISYWVAPWARRRGVATAAVRALTGHALANGFVRVELLTHAENAPSQRVALAAGFQREGVRRAAAPGRDGGRDDLVAWVRVAGDPPGPAPRLLPDLPVGGLTDGVVALRPFAVDDVDFVHELLSQPDVVATTVPPTPPERAAVAERCARSAGRWLAGERAELIIEDSASGRPAGVTTLYRAAPAGGEAMVGYSMSPHWRGRGYPTRAVRLLARWAFERVGIARLTAGTLPGNVASQRVLEKVGFRREGLLRGYLPGSGTERADAVTFGLLPADLVD